MTDENAKHRYFAAIVYRYDKEGNEQIDLETMEYRLTRSFGDFLISPLHAPDEDNDCEHWHVIYKHPSSVRLKPVAEFLSSLDIPWHNNFFLALHHPNNYQRYLLHLDNPEKEQFRGQTDLTVVNNFPVNLMRELSIPDKLKLQMEIEQFANEFNIFEYASMTLYLSNNQMFEHYLYFTTHTHHFGKYLDSLRYSREKEIEPDLDADE